MKSTSGLDFLKSLQVGNYRIMNRFEDFTFMARPWPATMQNYDPNTSGCLSNLEIPQLSEDNFWIPNFETYPCIKERFEPYNSWDLLHRNFAP